ncbi:MAG TPA: hypothetical protein DDZ89_12835, partial [Clostridiales bacterium]|nr:hypothetical protein [Clostridiales bacterium]
EYNPLHNGHLYHIQKTRELLNPDYILCVMSGNYTQRGEPAMVQKQIRTECALRSGIDCVIELPFVYATSSAEFFAGGGVSLLNALGCVTHISFGCETPNLNLLQEIAQILAQQPKKYTEPLKEYLDQGYGFAAARDIALHGVFPDMPDNMISGSNNILALEYLKWIIRLGSSIKPLPVQRKGAAYTDIGTDHHFNSAMAIRQQILKYGKVPEYVAQQVPECTYNLVKKECTEERCPLNLDKLNDFFQIYLRRVSPSRLNQYPFMEPGLENRLKNALDKSKDVSDIIRYTVTKRYPATRIKRLLLNILAGITQQEFDRFVKNSVPYARILGFNTGKAELLGFINRYSNIPVITKTSDVTSLEDGECKDLFDIEARTTDIYHYLYPSIQAEQPNEYEYRLIKV